MAGEVGVWRRTPLLSAAIDSGSTEIDSGSADIDSVSADIQGTTAGEGWEDGTPPPQKGVNGPACGTAIFFFF